MKFNTRLVPLFEHRSKPYQLHEMPLSLRRLAPSSWRPILAVTCICFLISAIGLYSLPSSSTPAESFAKISNTELVTFLSTGLSADSNLRAAIRAASTRESAEVARALAELKGHANFRVRIEVARALGLMKLQERPEVHQTLTELLKDEEYLVRGFAAQTLGNLGTKSALEILESALKTEENQVVRMSLIRALSR